MLFRKKHENRDKISGNFNLIKKNKKIMENKKKNGAETETEKTQNFKVHKAETPFTIVEKEKEFFITIGNNVMTEPFKSKKAAEEHIAAKPYALIINATLCCMELNKKINQ